MLEVVCGTQPINLQIEDLDEIFLLVQNVWRASEGGNILSAVDPELLNLNAHQLKTSSSSGTAPCEISPLTNSVSEPEFVSELSSNTFPAVTGDAIFNVGDVERKIVALLHLGLQCCSSDPDSQPSMRVMKWVILQLQGSTAEDTMAMLNSMPFLPSTVPVYESVPQVPNSTFEATSKVPLREGEVSCIPSSDNMSVLRRRFQSG